MKLSEWIAHNWNKACPAIFCNGFEHGLIKNCLKFLKDILIKDRYGYDRINSYL